MNDTPQIVSLFLKKAPILIVDRNFASRVAIRELLVEMGAVENQLVFCKSLSEAFAAVKKREPQLIISDYLLDDGLGTALLEKHGPRFIFFLLSSDTSYATVAKAAEEEVDNFMFKPYAQADFKKLLSETIEKRLSPCSKVDLIRAGKDAMASGELDQAIETFEKLKELQNAFAVGCSYLGAVKVFKSEPDLARIDYSNGLEKNDIHFRCMSGLYETLMAKQSTEEAYEILKKIVFSYPEHPGRLSQALTLAVKTKNFVDVETFYAVFESMHEKTDSLVNHMGSALSVNGRFHLMKKNVFRAMTSFERSLQLSSGQQKFMAYIVSHLTQTGFGREATELKKKYEAIKAVA